MLQAQSHRLDRDKIEMAQSAQVSPLEVPGRRHNVVKSLTDGARWHEKAQAKRLGESFVGRLTSRHGQVIDARLVAVHDEMPILVDHRNASTLGRMLAVDEDATAQVGGVCVHPGNGRGQVPVKNSQPYIPFQRAAKIDDGLIAESKPLSLLLSNRFCQMCRVNSRVE